jgi:hypothetical protein
MSDGPLLSAAAAARAMLAECHEWQQAVSAKPLGELNTHFPAVFPSAFSDLDAHALGRIFYDELPQSETGSDLTREELEALRPFALVWNDVSSGLRISSDAGGNCATLTSGKVIMQIELPTPTVSLSQPNGVGESVMRRYGRILRSNNVAEPGLWELSRNPGYLPLLDTQITGYIRTTEKEQRELGDAVLAEIMIDWGVGR